MSEKTYQDVEQEFWSPEKENDEVSGIYISNQKDVGENNSMVYNLEMPNANVMSVWGCTVLDTKMKLVKIGDDIKIVYLGMKKGEGKGKREYKDFKIQRATQE